MEKTYHIPVLLNESVDHLVYNPDGTYLDLTFGGGGHSKYILSKLSQKGKLFSFDKDTHALENALNDDRFTLIHHNFRYAKQFVKYAIGDQIDGILADLGISSFQINENDRGFAHRMDGPLDMRMDIDAKNSAADIIKNYSEKELLRVFRSYGEIKNAYKLTTTILNSRRNAAIQTVEEFKDTIHDCIPKTESSRYLSQVFQSLRIEVNQELKDLEILLLDANEILKSGGKLSVISYHSLEDRLVKNFLQTGNIGGKIEKDFFGNSITPFQSEFKKPITPCESEIDNNPRSRSAKLRVGIKK